MTVTVDVSTLRRMVSVPQTLESAGIRINNRKRADCPFCRGRSRLTLAYTDQLWHCHRCGKGGDVFKLVQEVRGCGFREALEILAQRAGLPSGGFRSSAHAFSAQLKRCGRIERVADKLARGERLLRLKYRDAIHDMESSKRRASTFLATMLVNPSAASLVDSEGLWQRLQETEERRSVVIAAYYLLSFGRVEDRARFLMRPTERTAMLAAIIESGFVLTDADRAKLMEVCFD